MTRPRRLILLTDGYHDTHTAKTAINIIRYKPEDVVAVLDRQAAGQTCQSLLGWAVRSPWSARWPTPLGPTPY
jgi:hypothetical protein